MPDGNLTNTSAAPADLPPTVATIDLSALAHNLSQVRRRISSTCEILAVVKADAYGHGAAAVTRALAQLGVSRFGVATLQEGVALREANVRESILIMGVLFPDQAAEVIAHRLTPVVYDADMVASLVRHTRSRPKPYPVHIKVDTGMACLGFAPERVLPLLQSPPFKGPLRAEGLMTHLADADSQDPRFTETQITRFRAVITQIQAAGLSVPLAHAANSAAILCYPSVHGALVRPGIMLYGYSPVGHGVPDNGCPGATGAPAASLPALEPVLSLTTKVAQVRTLGSGQSVSYNRSFVARRRSRIATLAIGYGHGYSRALSNRGFVLIGGRRAPIVGRVCMDMTLVDVTGIPGVRAGNEAVLIGCQGSERLWADEVASWLGTIPYEVLCAIGPRVTRLYTGGPAAPTPEGRERNRTARVEQR